MATLRVLVTDDETGMRMAVARSLRDYTILVPDVAEEVGFEVVEAGTGEAALETIERHPPDILLLDHKMPGISGLEVLERVSEMKLDMLTIMITAYASIETAVAATKQGAYDFLSKPFTPADLRNTIRKAATRVVLGKQARQLAEEKRQIRFQFIRVLGHELKAPLNAVDGYLQLIRQHKLGDDLAAYGELVDRSLLRIDGMRRLIVDLLDMTHIESGKRARHLEPLELRGLAQAAIETQQTQAAERSVTIELAPGGAVEMTADRSEIEMILNNLLSNAVKYNRPGGRVDVTLGKREGEVSIAVTDTGIGISAEESARLFAEFVRIRNEKTADILGSGLGLSIVKKLAELYDGRATVASQPEEGSTFTVVLCDPTGNPPAAMDPRETSQTS